MFDTGLTEIEEALRAITVALDPDTVPGSSAQTAMERFARIEKMAHAGARLMAKRVADTGAWKNRGHQSPADAVADAMGCTRGEAQRELGTADKLARGLDATDQAARRGELSPGQTGHVADAATVDPKAEADLLALAGSASTAELRDEARRRRHAAARDDVERHRRIHRNRSLRTWSDDDGGSRLLWSHLPELGAEVGAILDLYIEEHFHAARKAGRREHREAYAADAFVDALRDAAAYRRGESIDDDVLEDPRDADGQTADDADPPDTAAHPTADAPDPPGESGDPFAETAEESHSTGDAARDIDIENAGGAGVTNDEGHGHAGAGDGSGSRARSPGAGPNDRRRRRRTRRRGADAKVIVRIDHAALCRGHTEAGEVCEIAGVGPVPVASVVAMMDDAFLAAVVTDGVDIMNVVHLGRRPNALQLTALQATTTACTTLGCPNTARLENDHRDPYCDTKVTRVSGLDPSCPHCHDLKTYEGYRHTPGTGRRPLLSPAQQATWNRQHPDDPIAPLAPPGRRGPTRRTARPMPPEHRAPPRAEPLALPLDG